MTKREFKRSMRQGLGRCIITLSEEKSIEKYKDIVLWGCLHNLAHDPQCEGTRASYIYEMTKFFNDEDYFLVPLISAFEKLPHKSGWTFSHMASILTHFSENGNRAANDALLNKFHKLLVVVKNRRSNCAYNQACSNLESLCVSLVSFENEQNLRMIAENLGKLFRTNPRYNWDNFYWLYSVLNFDYGNKHIRSLLKNQSENILIFYQNYLEAQQEFQNNIPKQIQVPTAADIMEDVDSSDTLSRTLKFRFRHQADAEEKRLLAQEIIDEKNLDKKAELLSAFVLEEKGFPLHHGEIIRYSKSEHIRLQEIALDVLVTCQSDEVRQYALELLRQRKHVDHALQMLICNYRPEDKHLLLTELYCLKVDYKLTSDWHDIGLTILRTIDQGVKLPREFFLYIYNTTLCSFCRESAIRHMGKHRWLTRDIIEECRYDSNYDISEYINRYYPPKETKTSPLSE